MSYIGTTLYKLSKLFNEVKSINIPDKVTEYPNYLFSNCSSLASIPFGNNVKALLQKVIGNCNTNAQEEQRLVDVVCSRAKSIGRGQANINVRVDNIEDSIQELTTLRNLIEVRHTFSFPY